MTDLVSFDQHKKQLQAHYERLIKLIGQDKLMAEVAADLDRLQKAADELESELKFRVLCVGDFSTGKSTFINRFLLEQEILPAWPRPTTTVPTRICHGERLQAVRYRPSQRSDTALDAEIVTDNIRQTMKEWVSTADGNAVSDSTFPVIVASPAPLLAAGIEIVDAPGLNDPNPERMRLTLDYLNQADGVLFFINAMRPWTKYENKVFDGELLSRDLLGRLYIIVNYWDQIQPSERDGVLEHIKQQVDTSLASRALGPAAIPVLPVSSKTGEGAERIQQDLWGTLSARKSDDVLAFRIQRFNQEAAKYAQDLDKRLELLGLDAKGRSRERARVEQEVSDYAQQREAFFADLKRLLHLDFKQYRQALDELFQWLHEEVQALDQPANGATGRLDFKTLLPQRMSLLQQRAGQRLERINEDFVQQIRETIEKQKATIGLLPTKALTIEEYVLHWQALGANPAEQAVPLAGGVGIAGLLVGAGTLWQTATVVPAVTTTAAVPGLFAQIGTFFMGAPAATVTAAAAPVSSFMLLGVPAIAIGALAIGGAFLLKRSANEKSAAAIRAWVLECSTQVLAEGDRLRKQIKANEPERIAQICSDVDDDVSRAWQQRLAELDAIQDIEDEGAALRALRDQIAALTLTVNR